MQVAQVMTATDLKGELRYDEPMARHVSWRAGGKAKQYFIPADLDDIARLIASLPKDEKIMWMGLGSNTLFRDEGFDGTVIAMQGAMTELEMVDETHVYAGAGVSCAKLARFCARNQLQGAEWFAGIPGLIGGALAMNAGAFGGETWQHVTSVETLDHDGIRHKRSPGEYKVGYRSVQGPEKEWFTAATFEFEYGKGEGSVADIKTLLARRAETQPTGLASCGSVFTNPENDYAARLIEACGLKGYRVGGAVVSEKHANFIINDNKATATDIETLIKHIQKTVAEQQGVTLHTEVRIVGGAHD